MLLFLLQILKVLLLVEFSLRGHNRSHVTLRLKYPQILIKYFIFLRQCKLIIKLFGKKFVFLLLLLLLFWLWRFGGERIVKTQACLYQFLFFILQTTETILNIYVFEHFWQFFLFDNSSSFDKNSVGIYCTRRKHLKVSRIVRAHFHIFSCHRNTLNWPPLSI